MTCAAPIDVDDLATWPAGLADAVRGGGGSGAMVAEIVAGRAFRAFHCTRLLPSELDSIRRDGLRPSELTLVAEKLAAAVGAGLIDRERAERLEASSVMRPDARAGDRGGQVWLCVGLGHFSGRASGVEPLLSTWGGEGIFKHADEADREALRGIGTPTVVVVEVPLTGEHVTTFPGISVLLRAALGVGEEAPVGDVVARSAIGAASVVSVWQPGMAEFDRLRLPLRR